jgi:hypothetical protein
MIPNEIVSVDRLPPADITLPVQGRIVRPERALIDQLRDVSSAAACVTLYSMGIRSAFIQDRCRALPVAGSSSGGDTPVHAAARGYSFGHGRGTRREEQCAVAGVRDG